MAKNYIPEIARMLGVEIGEEFWIRDISDGEKFGSLYRFVDGQCRLEFNNGDGGGWHTTDGEDSISDLLFSHFEVVKKPWKPQEASDYWCIAKRWKAPVEVARYMWRSDELDLTRYRLGNCYRTKEEAEADREKWKRFYASDERIQWEDEA